MVGQVAQRLGCPLEQVYTLQVGDVLRALHALPRGDETEPLATVTCGRCGGLALEVNGEGYCRRCAGDEQEFEG